MLLSFEPCVVQVGESIEDAITQLVERDHKAREYRTTMYKRNDETWFQHYDTFGNYVVCDTFANYAEEPEPKNTIKCPALRKHHDSKAHEF